QVRDSIVASIPACHAGDRGSIPRHGICCIIFLTTHTCNIALVLNLFFYFRKAHVHSCRVDLRPPFAATTS
ncbi:hypothetical protein ACHAWF_018216, partial [Thalassiosira exigua]